MERTSMQERERIDQNRRRRLVDELVEVGNERARMDRDRLRLDDEFVEVANERAKIEKERIQMARDRAAFERQRQDLTKVIAERDAVIVKQKTSIAKHRLQMRIHYYNKKRAANKFK